MGYGELNFGAYGAGHSISTAFPVSMRFEGEGRYWFEVVVDKRVLTKVALNLKYTTGEQLDSSMLVTRLIPPTQS